LYRAWECPWGKNEEMRVNAYCFRSSGEDKGYIRKKKRKKEESWGQLSKVTGKLIEKTNHTGGGSQAHIKVAHIEEIEKTVSCRGEREKIRTYI